MRLPAPLAVGKVFGIPVRLDWSWMPTIPLYSWAIAAVYLPTNAPGRSQAEYWALGLLTSLLLVASVLAHELAHALVARAEGLEIEHITLHLFGGLARLSGEPETPRAEFKIAVVGPGASFAIGVLFLLLDTLFIHGTTALALGRVLRHLGIVNLILATFNLLPGFPLDGGHALRALLWHRGRDPGSALATAKSAGRSIALSLVGVGVYIYLFTDRLTGLWAISIGALLLLPLIATSRRSSPLAKGARAGDVMRRPPVTVGPRMTIEELVDRVLPEHKQTAFLVTEAGKLHGFVSLDAFRSVPRERWAETTVASELHPVDDSIFVSVADPTGEAARRLESNGVGHVAVVDADGQVVGTIGRDELRGRSGGRR